MQAIRSCDNCGASASQNAERCRECGSMLPNVNSDSLGLTTWWQWFIGLDGRVNRGGFLVRETLVFVLAILATAVAVSFSVFVVTWGLILVFIAIHVSSLVRRFHDRGMSGWSVLPYVCELKIVGTLPLRTVKLILINF